MRIDLCGNVRIETRHNAIDQRGIGGRQVLTVFAYLVVERHRAVPSDELAGALWPGRLPPSWQAALRVLVSKVRSLLADVGVDPAEALQNAFGCYQLFLPADAVIDLELATSAVSAAEQALADGDLDQACRRALEARRVLSEQFLPGDPSDWAEKTRDGMRSRRLRALDVLGEAHLSRRHPAAALEAAEEAVALDPFRESGYRALMAAHAHAGNRAAALRAYERCRSVLAEELGVDPSGETEAAYLDLLLANPADPHAGEGCPCHRADRGSGSARVAMPGVLDDAAANRLLGRDAELAGARLAASLATCGHRQLLLLAGEAGMGKTAVAARLAADLWDDGATVLYGRCDRDAIVAFQPFAEAIDRYARACPPERLRREVGRAGGDLAKLVVDLPRWVPDLTIPAPSEPDTERSQMFGSVAAFLQAVATTAPVVLILDDFHWAAAGTLALLRHLTRTLDASPVLIVACYRDDETDPGSSFRDLIGDARREGIARLVRLEGLDDAGVAALVRALPGGDMGNPGVVSALRRETGGNPLFVAELLHQFTASPRTTTGSELVTMASGGVGVPAVVQDVLRRRTDRLSTPAKHLLEVAAVIGQPFDIGLLEQVTGLTEEVIVGAIDETMLAQLIVEAPEGMGLHCFASSLSREAVHGNISGTRRAYLHRLVGRALALRITG